MCLVRTTQHSSGTSVFRVRVESGSFTRPKQDELHLTSCLFPSDGLSDLSFLNEAQPSREKGEIKNNKSSNLLFHLFHLTGFYVCHHHRHFTFMDKQGKKRNRHNKKVCRKAKHFPLTSWKTNSQSTCRVRFCTKQEEAPRTSAGERGREPCDKHVGMECNL